MVLQLSKSLKILIFTVCVLVLLPTINAWALTGGGSGATFGTELDAHAPEPGMYYIRQTPIIFHTGLEPTEDGTIRVVGGILAWADQFSSAELGVIEGEDRTQAKTLTYVKLNDNIDFNPTEGEKEIVLPVSNSDIVDGVYRLPKTTVSGSQDAIFAKIMMPSKENFSQQENGITSSVAKQFEMTNLTPKNTKGEQYYKVAGTASFPAGYHQMEYNHDYMDNWKEFKGFNPGWDDWEPNAQYFTNAPAADPNFVGFYWGRKWHELLGSKDNYGATYTEPGMISAVGPPPNNLKVEITNAPTKAMVGEPVSISAKVTNENNKYIVTNLIVKVNGEIIRDIQDFDLHSFQDVTADFIMPSTNATVEFLVNPNKDKPIDELIWSDNIAVATVIKTDPPPAKKGSIKVTINQPKGKVPFAKPWNFTVRVTGYFPPPPPESDESNTATVSLRATGKSKAVLNYRLENGLYGYPIILEEKPVNFDQTITFDVQRGQDFDVTKTFTFPWSTGHPGKDYPIPLHAKASWRSYSGEDTKQAIIHHNIMDPEIKLTK